MLKLIFARRGGHVDYLVNMAVKLGKRKWASRADELMKEDEKAEADNSSDTEALPTETDSAKD